MGGLRSRPLVHAVRGGGRSQMTLASADSLGNRPFGGNRRAFPAQFRCQPVPPRIGSESQLGHRAVAAASATVFFELHVGGACVADRRLRVPVRGRGGPTPGAALSHPGGGLNAYRSVATLALVVDEPSSYSAAEPRSRAGSFFRKQRPDRELPQHAKTCPESLGRSAGGKNAP
jgi:hypothetical protein